MRYHVVRALAVALIGLLFACGDNDDPPPVDADTTDAGPIDSTEDCDAAGCAQPTCTDGTENGDETDVDCGGSCAPTRRCGDGLGCGVAGDCQSGVCTGGTCAAPACGDGVRQGQEACDDGNHTNGDGCDDGTGGNCRPTGCGNGVRSGTEECDDGNSTQGDGCDNNCTTTGCGNGVITTGEVCDDDDAMGGDGCSATCQVEPGFSCSMVPSVCVGMCGDGVVVSTEACDDAPPAESGDGCSIMCMQEPGFTCTGSPSVCSTSCGDGVRAGGEGCDDAPPAETNNDGCSAACFVEPGWVCVGTPSLCFPICGDGRVVGTEACDDPAPADNGDGCSSTCTVEPGWTCAPGSPSACTPICGDGLRLGGEMCDDAPPAEAGDGCSGTCTVELGWTCMGNMPSTCTTTCGDGIRAGAEMCDDAAPAENGDGCSATCTVEAGYMCTGFMPSTCAPICGDGLVKPGEPCDDAPPAEDSDGCSAMCTVEPGYVCNGEPSTCQLTCGDGDVDPGEACDDAAPAEDGDGCSAACTIEFGFACMGSPSVCASACGDGVKASNEQCDDAPPAESNNDGCSATCTIETGFNCVGNLPSVCTTTCGDGIRGGVEQCDDGCGPGTPGVCDASDNGDGCTSTCTLECGDGVLDPAIEQCDDGGRVAGDGCSPTCQFEVTCGPGENLVQIISTDVPKTIQDNVPAGADSNAVVPVASQGAIRKAVIGIGRISHTYTGDVVVSITSPVGRKRTLVAQRGGSGDHFINTRFDDDAGTAVSAGTAPFSGAFRPEQSISSLAGFGSQSAAGTWRLNAADVSGGIAGTLDAWTLSLCVDPTAACGNGIPDIGEECDDGNIIDNDACNNQCGLTDGCGDGNIDGAEACDDDNLISGDGCSSTCQPEMLCAAGETPVIVTDLASQAIPDDQLFHAYPANVAVTGGVTKAQVFLRTITHPNTGQLDIQLLSPGVGAIRNLSDDNGTTANYVQTLFDDSATTAITAGVVPYTGRFRPEQSLSTTQFTDFRGINAAGTWNLEIKDDTTGTVGTLDGWALGLCVNPTAPFCGDALPAAGEECDDGNINNGDVCSNLCQLNEGCGDGNLDAGEECDDNNITSGDGCSATCVLDITCGASETAVIVRDTTSQPIPDGNTTTFFDFNLAVAQVGAVKKAIVHIAGITHSNTLHLDIQLASPGLRVRDLSSDNGSANYAQTFFDDAAATAITSGSAPFTGQFRPEQTLSTTTAVDFRDLNAAGTWHLQIRDDTSGTAGTLNGWTLALCVNATANYCGDGIPDLAIGEECDDGNAVDNDMCSNLCQVADGCGDANLDLGEECDDGNVISGDGCSSACVLDISCGAGEMAVIVRNTTAVNLPDSTVAGVLSSPIVVPVTGVVRRVIPTVNITHTQDNDVDIWLMSPYGVQRDLSTDNGSTNDHFRATTFSDSATTGITSGAAPFTGTFIPEQSISNAAGFANQTAGGSWYLRVADDATAGQVGTLDGWSLALCIDTSVASVCGNGFVEQNEQCDDANIVASDGCSSTCQLELTCDVSQTPVIVRTAPDLIIPDNNPTGVTSTITVAQTGTVRKAIVSFTTITHTNDTDLDITFTSPTGTNLDVASDVGSSDDDFVSTILDDTATAALPTTTGQGPFRGRFRPETALSGVDGQAANGVWSLKVVDDLSSNSGVLRSWALGLCVE